MNENGEISKFTYTKTAEIMKSNIMNGNYSVSLFILKYVWTHKRKSLKKEKNGRVTCAIETFSFYCSYTTYMFVLESALGIVEMDPFD